MLVENNFPSSPFLILTSNFPSFVSFSAFSPFLPAQKSWVMRFHNFLFQLILMIVSFLSRISISECSYTKKFSNFIKFKKSTKSAFKLDFKFFDSTFERRHYWLPHPQLKFPLFTVTNSFSVIADIKIRGVRRRSNKAKGDDESFIHL